MDSRGTKKLKIVKTQLRPTELSTSHLQNASLNLLIVEDNLDLQEYYRILFRMTNWNLIQVIENGLMAIQYYQELFPKPLVIVLDIDLPGCSGFEVARQILKDHPSQKIVFVSGMISDSSLPADLRTVPWLAKPFRVDEILQTLETLRGG